jgi:hypothetical protein
VARGTTGAGAAGAKVVGPVGTAGHPTAPRSPMGVTLSSRCRVRAGASLIEWVWTRADLVEKSEAEGRKLRRASISSRSLIDGGRVLCFGSAVTSSIGGLPAPGRAEPGPAAGYVRGLCLSKERSFTVAHIVTQRPHSPATTPFAASTGSGARGSPAGRERSERGREAALTSALSDRHSPARVVATAIVLSSCALVGDRCVVNRLLGQRVRSAGSGISASLER